MWDVYHLIKSGALKPITWESSWDKLMREAEEKRQIFAEGVLSRIPSELSELEKGLVKLGEVLDEKEKWEIASDVDQNSRMICFYTFFGMISPKVKDYYTRVIQALQKTSEIFARYSDFDLFSEFSRDRKESLIELAKKYQLESA